MTKAAAQGAAPVTPPEPRPHVRALLCGARMYAMMHGPRMSWVTLISAAFALGVNFSNSGSIAKEKLSKLATLSSIEQHLFDRAYTLTYRVTGEKPDWP